MKHSFIQITCRVGRGDHGQALESSLEENELGEFEAVLMGDHVIVNEGNDDRNEDKYVDSRESGIHMILHYKQF